MTDSKQLTISDHLYSRSLSSRFTHARYDKAAKFAVERDYAITIVEGNNKLQKCIPETVGRCILDVGVMGVSLNPVRKEAYLIPYYSSDAGQYICTLSVSYMGMEQVAYRTGLVKSIQTNIVREGDTLRIFTKNNRRYIEHEESTGIRGKVTHSYCIAIFTNGETHIEVMDRVQIMAVRAAATKKNNGTIPFTWAENNPFRYEMYKKAPLRRGWKHWPKSSDQSVNEIAELIDRQDPVDFEPATTPNEETAGEATMTITDKQIGELRKLMDEVDIKPQAQDRWLIAMAKSMGYQSVEAIKASDYEKAKENMTAGIAGYVERKQGKS